LARAPAPPRPERHARLTVGDREHADRDGHTIALAGAGDEPVRTIGETPRRERRR